MVHPKVRILLLVILVTFHVGCSPGIDSSESQKHLNRGLNGEPESLSPLIFESNQAAAILHDIGEGLVYFNGKGELVGGVAESWSVDSTGTRYRFILRSNARWSNGLAVEAKHFVNGLRRLANPLSRSPHIDIIRMIDNAPEIRNGDLDPKELGVFEISQSELVIQLHTVTPYFIQMLAHPSTFPVPELAEKGEFEESGSFFGQISNGAYRVAEWNVGSDISLIRNDFYWNDSSTYFDSVTYHFLESEPELLRFRAGGLDITSNVPPAQFKAVQREFADQLHVSPYLGVYFYGFNLKNPVFRGDLNIRRALSLAIDREALVDLVIGRGEAAAFGWVPDGVLNYESQKIGGTDLSYSQRVSIAKELYRAAGYGVENPLHFELRYNTSDVQERIALAIQDMWRKTLGAEAKLVNEEFGVLLENIRSGLITQVFRLSWTGDYNDAHAFLQIFHSKHPTNLTGFSSSDYDKLITQSESEGDPMKRRALMEDAEKILLEHHAVIPIYFYVSKHLVAEEIENWHPNVLDRHPTHELRIRGH